MTEEQTNAENTQESTEQTAEQVTDNKEVTTAENNPETSTKEPSKAEVVTEEAPKETEKPKKSKKVAAIKDDGEEEETAHDDFNWDVVKENSLDPTRAMDDLEKQYEGTLSFINEHEIISGVVEVITASDVVLNIGFKSDGLVPLNEFRDNPDLKIGDPVEVYVEKTEDSKGALVLSRKKAKLMKAWDNIVDAHNNDKMVTGNIISKTKGGLIVNVFGLETFLPGSQIDVKPIVDYDAYVGKKMEFKVVKINEVIKNAVVSHKALIESDIEEQRAKIIGTLEKGQVLEGVIKNITDFGAFIDLGGVDGLLYITDISWGRINHPNEVLEINQKINVCVLDFDDDKKRISLGLKQLMDHPWQTLPEDIKEGSIVKGKIVNIEDYGAFLEIVPGVEGLVHVSEVTWSYQPVNARDSFELNQEFEAKVVTIDREERKMSLSVKQLTADPWEGIEDKFAVGSQHSGEVQNITPYGVFVEFGDGLGGMVHISDLSWTKRYNHPSEFTKLGENLETIVLEIDKENRKLKLGHKQLEEDPWDTFETVFPIGSIHEGVVTKRMDKGAIVQLQYGVEAFAPNRHIKKEDGTLAEPDQTLQFMIIEFDRNDKKILASHTKIHEKAMQAEKNAERSEKRKEQATTSKAIKGMKGKIEKTTLGELDALSALKAKMQKNEVAEAKVKLEAKEAEKKKKEEPKEKVEKAPAAKKEPAKKAKKEEAVEMSAEETDKAKADLMSKLGTVKEGEKDDLKKIIGVGPVMEKTMNEIGIFTYEQVSKMKQAEYNVLDSLTKKFPGRAERDDWAGQAKELAKGK